MKHAPPALTQAQIQAFVASVWAWLRRLAAVLLSPSAHQRRRRLARLVQIGERRVEYVLFAMAAQRLIARGPRRRRTCLVIPRPGFRIARGDNRLLLKSAHIRLRSRDLAARIIRLLAALVAPEPYVARYTKRLARGLRYVRLIARAPGAVAFASAALQAPALVDSS